MADLKEKRKVGRPQRYVLWSDWERWILTEWNPFKMNDLPHLKNDVSWLKRIMVGILIAIIGAAVAIIVAR